MNLFLDTNVLLDVLGRREPYYADSAVIWTLAETAKAVGHVSALSFPNIYYVLRRLDRLKTAQKALTLMRDIFNFVPLDAQILHQAMDADIRDFEDAIQFFSAIRADAACLITRNPRHFPQGNLVIQTPAEFLATFTER